MGIGRIDFRPNRYYTVISKQFSLRVAAGKSRSRGVIMARLMLFFLGPFQATLDGRPVLGFESNKVRALLAYLAVEAARPHARETVAALLWPDHHNHDCAHRQLELEAWDEATHRRLIRLLARTDRRGQALLQYEACRRVLHEELDVAPSHETTALYERIRDETL